MTRGVLKGGREGSLGTWKAMRRRCYDPNAQQYPRYGGRGIMVCDRWRSFEAFLEDMGERPEGCSLDRIDNDRDYCPENCRWASAMVQRHNQGKIPHMPTIDGVTRPVTEWAKIAGIPVNKIMVRLGRGWPDRDAVFGRPWSGNRPRFPRLYQVKLLPKKRGRKPVEGIEVPTRRWLEVTL